MQLWKESQLGEKHENWKKAEEGETSKEDNVRESFLSDGVRKVLRRE